MGSEKNDHLQRAVDVGLESQRVHLLEVIVKDVNVDTDYL